MGTNETTDVDGRAEAPAQKRQEPVKNRRDVRDEAEQKRQGHQHDRNKLKRQI